jgi:hypothetical protein
MNRLHAAALAATLALLPTLALADMVDLPRLTFADATTAPATQSCIQPGALTASCRTGH